MSNPSQKSGNSKYYHKKGKVSKKDLHTKRIAKMEVQKALSKKIESKVVDQSYSAIPLNTGGSFTRITQGISRGTNEGEFVGDSIMPTHLRIRWAVQGADYTNIIRIIVVQNKAGGVPVGGTLLQAAVGVNRPLSAYNTSYQGTYKVLFDEFYSTVSYPTASSLTVNAQLTGDIIIKAKKMHKIEFDSLALPSAGDIYLCCFSDSSALSPPIMQFYSRLYYKDA